MKNNWRSLRCAYRWDRERRRLDECRFLTEALGIHQAFYPRVISLVGAGGKTTAMYRLAWELSELGKRVLVTTTTHIVRPDLGRVLEIEHMCQVTEAAWQSSEAVWRNSESARHFPVVTAGLRQVRSDDGGMQKLAAPAGMEAGEFKRLLKICDVILIEADGAAHYPVKVPRQGEPVILPQTELLIGSVGLSGLGQTWEDGCFRFESDGAWLGCCAGERILPKKLAQLLSDERGTKKDLPASRCRYQILFNQADDSGKVKMAKEVIAALPEKLQENCAVTAYGLE